MTGERCYAPHCDSAVLHSPKGYPVVGALVTADEGRSWALRIHRIGAAPWLSARSITSQASPVPPDTGLRVIPLTQPAWSALASHGSATSPNGPNARRIHVAGVALTITDDHAASTAGSGVEITHPRPNAGWNWRRDSAGGWTSVDSSSELSDPSHARTVVIRSLGTSWSLTTDPGGAETRIERSPASSAQAASGESGPSWLSAIWSVLTAIERELTTEQWQRESARLRHCVYCDEYPDWQEYRQRAHIAFSDEQPVPDGKSPCPSSWFRSPLLRDLWSGNVPKEPMA